MATIPVGNHLTPGQFAILNAQCNAIANSAGTPVAARTFKFWAGFDGTNNIKDKP